MPVQAGVLTGTLYCLLVTVLNLKEGMGPPEWGALSHWEALRAEGNRNKATLSASSSPLEV